MIVTVGNTKGGVGKTTLALNLAIARALAGRDVWLVDADPQGTAQTAISIRADSDQQPAIACTAFPKAENLKMQVPLQASKFDDVIIDAGGRDSEALRVALSLSDLLIVPFQPRSFDVWALNDIGGLVDMERQARERHSPNRALLRAVAVLNCADPGEQSTDNTEAAAAVADVPQFQYLATPIRRRKSFANAAGAGLSVLELKPADKKASSELNALILALF